MEYKYILSNIFIVSAAYLFKSFYRISLYAKRLQKQVSTRRQLVTIFMLPVQRKWNEQLFKVRVIND